MHSFHNKHRSIWLSKLTSITNKCLNKHFGRRLTKWFLWLLIFNSKTSQEPFSTSVEMRKCTLEELCWSGDTWANKLSHYSAGAAAPGEGLMPLRGLFASVLSKWLWGEWPRAQTCSLTYFANHSRQVRRGLCASFLLRWWKDKHIYPSPAPHLSQAPNRAESLKKMPRLSTDSRPKRP